MSKIPVILVGGFLGAGKTTLIAAASRHLADQGKRAGLITNDQAANLVDTTMLSGGGLPIQEVSGGCFCCRFDDLVAAMERIVEGDKPDLLIGEPVGSCTDLSATVLQPMKQLLTDRFVLAPFSVLVDATQVRTDLDGGQGGRFPEKVRYIYRKQLEEADNILLNKVDLISSEELDQLTELLKREFPQAAVFSISALAETGVDSWLTQVMSDQSVGRTITEVDYDTYADGEAALGWLNAAVALTCNREGDVDWQGLCMAFMQGMQGKLQSADAEIAHLKLHLKAGDGGLVANLTSSHGQPTIRGQVDAPSSSGHLLINVRAHIDPDRLRSITEECLHGLADHSVELRVEDLSSFAPSRPEPTHRFSSVI